MSLNFGVPTKIGTKKSKNMIAIGKSNKSDRQKSKLYGPNVSKVPNRIIHRDHISIDKKTDEKHSWTFMYALPPVGQITLEDFESSTIDRLKCKSPASFFPNFLCVLQHVRFNKHVVTLKCCG